MELNKQYQKMLSMKNFSKLIMQASESTNLHIAIEKIEHNCNKLINQNQTINFLKLLVEKEKLENKQFAENFEYSQENHKQALDKFEANKQRVESFFQKLKEKSATAKISNKEKEKARQLKEYLKILHKKLQCYENAKTTKNNLECVNAKIKEFVNSKNSLSQYTNLSKKDVTLESKQNVALMEKFCELNEIMPLSKHIAEFFNKHKQTNQTELNKDQKLLNNNEKEKEF